MTLRARPTMRAQQVCGTEGNGAGVLGRNSPLPIFVLFFSFALGASRSAGNKGITSVVWGCGLARAGPVLWATFLDMVATLLYLISPFSKPQLAVTSCLPLAGAAAFRGAMGVVQAPEWQRWGHVLLALPIMPPAWGSAQVSSPGVQGASTPPPGAIFLLSGDAGPLSPPQACHPSALWGRHPQPPPTCRLGL